MRAHQLTAQMPFMPIAQIDFQTQSSSKADQRPARIQPKAERKRCLGLRANCMIAPTGRENPSFGRLPEIYFGNHYGALATVPFNF